MSRFSYEDQLTTSASVDEAADAVRHALTRLGAKPESAGEVVVGRLGSQWKVRLLGLALGSISWMPLRITVEVADPGPVRSIRLDVAEDFGYGSLAGVEGRARARCQEVLTQLVDEVESRLPPPSAA